MNSKHDSWVSLKPYNPYPAFTQQFPNKLIPTRDPFPTVSGFLSRAEHHPTRDRKPKALFVIDRARAEDYLSDRP